MDNNYKELENQIGEMGGETPQETPKKLKYKSSYGQKEDLNKSEKDSLDDFLAKGKRLKEETQPVAQISQGWIPVDRSELGQRSLFYPENWEFFVRPATIMAIKNWTAIDEERPDQVHKTFNDIIRTCVKITSNGEGISWTNLNSWDRFWFVMKVREYTFINGENRIEFEDACSECGADVKYTLTSGALFYDFPDEDIIEKYWDGSKWTIDPKEYGLDHSPITLYTPNLGKDDAIIEWATAKARQKQKIDETFINFLVWMIQKPMKDTNAFDRQVQKAYNEYKNWDIDTFSFISDVIKNITINPSERLRCICPQCCQEATSEVRFPSGIRSLFQIESKVKKFGSK